MGFTWGGYQCELPDTIYAACRAQNLPVDRFHGLANKWINPGGATVGRGWVLMRRQSFLQVDPNTLQTLVITDDKGNSITIQNTLLIRAWCVTPGYETDPLGCMLLELADVRWFCSNPRFTIPLLAQYNVHAKASADVYYVASTFDSDGTPWTWQTMLDNMWDNFNIAELGDPPKLPYVPDGLPHNFIFECADGWAVYNAMLRRLSCQLCFDPTASDDASNDVPNDVPFQPFSIIRLGILPKDDNGVPIDLLGNALQTYRPQLIFDSQVVEGDRAKFPASVNVVFHKVSRHYGTERTTRSTSTQWISTPATLENQPDPIVKNDGNPPVSEPSSTHFLFDDMPYVVDFDGSDINPTQRTARAKERIANYYLALAIDTLHKIYRGIISDNGFFPGPFITGVAWYDVGDGLKTEIFAYPGSQSIDGGTLRPRDSEPLGDVLAQRNLNDSLPNYPQTQQNIVIGLPAQVGPPLIYQGVVLVTDPALVSSNVGELVYAFSRNGNTLPLGQVVTGKLNGSRTVFPGDKRPFYVVTEGVGGGGGKTVVSDASCVAGSLSVTKITL